MSQCEPEENGNDVSFSPPKKLPNQLYKYDFVINNYVMSQLSQLNQSLTLLCKKAVYGLEVGESGTPHIQGYMSLKIKKRITELQKYPCFSRASFRQVRNEQACIEYCMKDNTHFKLGFPLELKIIENLRPFQQSIVDMLIQPADERTINWLYDPETMIGKTALTKYLIVKHGAVFFTSGRKSDIAYQLNMEKVENNKDLNNNLICIFNLSFGESINYTVYENLKDGLISSSKYKSCGLVFNSPHVWIFSNSLPDEEIVQQRKGVWKVWIVVNNCLVCRPYDAET